MIKLWARWMPLLVTMKQKQRLEDDSNGCLTMFPSNKADFLRRFITRNETWVHHFTPETKVQSEQLTERGESAPKKGEYSSIWWLGHGVSFLGCTWDNFHWLSSKRKKNQRRVLCKLITAFEWWNQDKTTAFGESGQRFANSKEVESAVNSYFQELDDSHYKRTSLGKVYRAKRKQRWKIKVFLTTFFGFSLLGWVLLELPSYLC